MRRLSSLCTDMATVGSVQGAAWMNDVQEEMWISD